MTVNSDPWFRLAVFDSCGAERCLSDVVHGVFAGSEAPDDFLVRVVPADPDATGRSFNSPISTFALSNGQSDMDEPHDKGNLKNV